MRVKLAILIHLSMFKFDKMKQNCKSAFLCFRIFLQNNSPPKFLVFEWFYNSQKRFLNRLDFDRFELYRKTKKTGLLVEPLQSMPGTSSPAKQIQRKSLYPVKRSDKLLLQHDGALEINKIKSILKSLNDFAFIFGLERSFISQLSLLIEVLYYLAVPGKYSQTGKTCSKRIK